MPFQPGTSGNRLGIPKRPRIITQRLIALLNETDADNTPKLYRFANTLFDRALEGDMVAIKEVIDRVEGKVPQPIAGDPDNPLTISTVIHEIVRPDPTQRSTPALIDASDPKAA